MSLIRNICAAKVLWFVGLLCLSAGLQATPASAAYLIGVRVEPSNLTLEPDQTYFFHAFAEYSDDTSADITRFAIWRSSSSAIARVSNESGSVGVVTTRGPGDVKISAAFYDRDKDNKGKADLIVDAGPVAYIRTKPTTKSLEVGQTETFTARAVYATGYDVDISDRVRWSSSAPQIASVVATGDDAGNVSAHQIGNVAIGAFDTETGLRSTDGAATVRARVTHIDFEEPAYLLGTNMQLPLRVYAYRTDGTRTQITDDVTFHPQASTIATIIEDGQNAGQIEPHREGTVAVDAFDPKRGLRASNSLGRTTIQVEGLLREILIDPLTITVGESRNARAHGLLSTGAVTSDLRRGVFWETADASIATVSNTTGNPGSVTGRKTGLTTLVATDPGTGITSLQTNNLGIRGSIASIEIEPKSLRLGIGLRYPMRAYAKRADGSRSNITNSVEWTSTNEALLSVDENGWVQAFAAGQSVIQAFHPPTELSSFGDTQAKVTIAGTVTGIEIRSMRVEVGGQRKAKVYGKLADGTETDDLRSALEWSVTDPSLARVGSAAHPDLDPGEVEGLAAGWTTLQARDPNNGWLSQGIRNLKIQGSIVSIAMEVPDVGNVPAGTEAQFKIRALFEDTERSNISDKCEWSSDDPTIASVNNESPDKGVVTATRAGATTTIRANCNGRLAASEVHVLGQSISLQFGNQRKSFSAFRSYRFRVFAEHEGGELIDVTREAAWVLTNHDVAQFDPKEPGRVNFLDSGTTFLIAASENGFFAITELIVTGGVNQLVFTPKRVTLRGGSGRRLRVTGTRTDERGEIFMTRFVTLESSDENIVRLAPTEKEPGRILTGGTTGTATITASTSSGVKAQATVRVIDVLESIEIEPRQDRIGSGETGRFRVLGIYQNGRRRYLTRYTEVTSSDPSVISLSAQRGKYGRMYAGRRGEATLQAIDPGSGVSSAPVTIHVTALP